MGVITPVAHLYKLHIVQLNIVHLKIDSFPTSEAQKKSSTIFRWTMLNFEKLWCRMIAFSMVKVVSQKLGFLKKKTPAAWHFEWVIHLYITLGIQLIHVSGLGYRYQTYGHFRFFVAIVVLDSGLALRCTWNSPHSDPKKASFPRFPKDDPHLETSGIK